MLTESKITTLIVRYAAFVGGANGEFDAEKAEIYRTYLLVRVEERLAQTRARLVKLRSRVDENGGWEQVLKFYAEEGVLAETLLRNLADLRLALAGLHDDELRTVASMLGAEYTRVHHQIIERAAYSRTGSAASMIIEAATQVAAYKYGEALENDLLEIEMLPARARSVGIAS